MSRFFVNPENIGNNLIILNDADDLHHMMKVLRLKEGDEVDISDGAEWEYHARSSWRSAMTSRTNLFSSATSATCCDATR